MIIGLVTVFVLAIITKYLHGYYSNQIVSYLNVIMVRGSFIYFGWFAAGCCFYVYFKENKSRWFIVGVLITLLSSFFIKDANWNSIFAAILVSMFFALSLLNIQIQNFLS